MAEYNDATQRTGHSANTTIEELIRSLEALTITKGNRHTAFKKEKVSPTLPIYKDVYKEWDTTKERYEENLCLLMQDFERKAQHIARLIKIKFGVEEWPEMEVEEAALQLSSALDGVEWRKVVYRAGYAEEIDWVWRSEQRYAKEHGEFKVLWEYVTGMARLWDKGREGDPHIQRNSKGNGGNQMKDSPYIMALSVPKVAHLTRKNRYIGVNEDFVIPGKVWVKENKKHKRKIQEQVFAACNIIQQ